MEIEFNHRARPVGFHGLVLISRINPISLLDLPSAKEWGTSRSLGLGQFQRGTHVGLWVKSPLTKPIW